MSEQQAGGVTITQINMPNTTRPFRGKPTRFKLGVRMTNGFKDGVPHYIGKGTDDETVTIPFEQAERWKLQGLGTIEGDAAPLEVKGKQS